MQHRKWLFSLAAAATLLLLAVVVPCFWSPSTAQAGLPHSSGRYAVLAPITLGNLTIFPVVSGESHETKEFLPLRGARTLDSAQQQVRRGWRLRWRRIHGATQRARAGHGQKRPARGVGPSAEIQERDGRPHQ